MIDGVGNVGLGKGVVMVIGYYGWLRRIGSGWEIIVIMTIFDSRIGDFRNLPSRFVWYARYVTVTWKDKGSFKKMDHAH